MYEFLDSVEGKKVALFSGILLTHVGFIVR